MTLRERLEALRDWFDARLDRIAERIEPLGERFDERNQSIDAWFERERPSFGRAGAFLLRLLYRLAKTVALLLVFAVFFLIVAPIAIILLLIVAAVVFSPVWIPYVGIWLLLGAVGVKNDTVRLLVLVVLTYVIIRIIRRVMTSRE